MYYLGEGQQFGPGNALVERYGMSGYVSTPDFSATPAGQMGIRGLGCGCSSCDCNKGVGAWMDGTGLLGTGLFASNSPADWGIGEWATIIIGSYVVLSVFDTTRRGARAARAGVRAASSEYGIRRGSFKPAKKSRK